VPAGPVKRFGWPPAVNRVAGFLVFCRKRPNIYPRICRLDVRLVELLGPLYEQPYSRSKACVCASPTKRITNENARVRPSTWMRNDRTTMYRHAFPTGVVFKLLMNRGRVASCAKITTDSGFVVRRPTGVPTTRVSLFLADVWWNKRDEGKCWTGGFEPNVYYSYHHSQGPRRLGTTIGQSLTVCTSLIFIRFVRRRRIKP